MPIDLDTKSLDVLRAIYQQGIVRGADLKRTVSLAADDELKTAVDKLLNNSLVAVSGAVNSPQELLRSFVSVRPSASVTVKRLIGAG